MATAHNHTTAVFTGAGLTSLASSFAAGQATIRDSSDAPTVPPIRMHVAGLEQALLGLQEGLDMLEHRAEYLLDTTAAASPRQNDAAPIPYSGCPMSVHLVQLLQTAEALRVRVASITKRLGV